MDHRYAEFLESKRIVSEASGFEVLPDEINPILYDFQRDIVRWALTRGCSAVFADCGLGKSFIQLEWARLVSIAPGSVNVGRILIVAPLAVARQTIGEGSKLGLPVRYVTSAAQLESGINITNYERLTAFIGAPLSGIVLDESSILKSIDGATRKLLLSQFTNVPYRLCCTATPCPNDIAELANHAEFLGVMKRAEMLASFFVHDQDGWRLRGHAKKAFYRWLASWSMALKSPADLGYDGSRFVLPPLEIHDEVVETEWRKPGHLFAGGLHGITDRADVRKASVSDRKTRTIEVIVESWIKKNTVVNGGSNIETIKLKSNTNAERQNGLLRETPNGGNSIEIILSHLKRRFENTTTIIPVRLNGQKSNPNTVSLKKKLKPVSNSKEIVAPFVFQSVDGAQRTDSTLTTMQTLGRLEASSAQVATLALANLEKIQTLSDAQLSTWNLPQWIVWCGLNSEQDRLAEALGPLCVSIDGRSTPEQKEVQELAWRSGEVPILITKPRVFGYGMNWQHCPNMIFLGLGDSYETYYQCIRRELRYGQKQPVHVYIVVTDHERQIVDNVRRKEVEAETLSSEIIAAAREYEMEELGKIKVLGEVMERKTYVGDGWRIEQGDCVQCMSIEPDDSVDLSVYSPPFLSLYQYSASTADMGNSRDPEQFFSHFGFMSDELLRMTKPGRNTCVHVSQVPTTLLNHGVIGFQDFRGRTILAFQSHGWIYHGEVCIDKDPQAQAIRTHAKGLAFQQLKKDSSWLRPAMADYVLVFRKPGDNAIPIHPDMNNDEWIEWARPIWYGIRESETLNVAEARSAEDDRHICPLQLGTIERCIRLWSNEGETVFSPFAGIGSEGHEAIRLGRKFIGCELKPLYAKTAATNIQRAATLVDVPSLFQ